MFEKDKDPAKPKKKRWSNKEVDGTIFMCVVLGLFGMLIVMTYRDHDFAVLETTEKALELVKYLLIFIAGFTYKAATDAANARKHEEEMAAPTKQSS